jgi:DNA invertase Pin-like site-specific DNA recombinase
MQYGERLRAIGYARVSKPRKRKDGSLVRDSLSIAAQRDSIERAADYNGWDLIDIVEDDGKSGANVRRDGFQQVLSRLKAREADMLVVARHDRPSRDLVDFSTLLKRAERQGWYLSVLDQKIDTSTAMGWYMAHQLALSAELERRLISERTRDALAVLKDNGVQLGQPSTIPDTVQRTIMRMHRDGQSRSAIARALTAKGIPTPTGGTTWHHSVVGGVIKRNLVTAS